MAVRHGYIFESELGRGLQLLKDQGKDIWTRKLVDTKLFDLTVYCPYCSNKVTHNLILPKTIADYIVISDNQVTFIECKSSENKTSYPLANIEPHQIESSLQCDSYDTVVWYWIICKRHGRGDIRAFILTADELNDLMRKVRPKKSIKWELIEEVALELPRLTKEAAWNLNELSL